MSSQHVCFNCSRQLLRFNKQLRTSSFVSLGKIITREDGSKEQAQDEPVVKSKAATLKTSHRKKRLSFAQQYQEQRKPTGVDKVLETLFSSTRAPENVGQVSRYSRTPKDQKYEDAANDRIFERRLFELHNQLKRGTSRIEYIWASCLQLLGERNWTSSSDPSSNEKRKVCFIVFRDILLALCSKQRITVHDTVVTPSYVIGLYRKHGVMKAWWHRVIWAQLGQMVRLKYANADAKVTDDAKANILLVLQDLLEVWSIFVERYEMSSSVVTIKGDAENSAAAKDRRLGEGTSPRGAVDEILNLLPKLPFNVQTSSLAAGAILTLDALNVEDVHCSPLLGDFFRKIQQAGSLKLSVARAQLSKEGIALEIIQKALMKWDRSPEDPESRPPLARDTLGEREPTTALDWSQSSIQSRVDDIEGALNREKAKDAIHLWENYLQYLKRDENNDKATSDRIFASFLRVFWAIPVQDRAIEVWNYMVESGRTLNKLHWTAMLLGCVRARDAKSLQEIWEHMSRSNLEPDNHLWTTYIHGLIKNYRLREGFQALESLGRVWKHQSALENPDTSDQQSTDMLTPTIAPVRAALSALIEINKPELTPTVIAWAESQKLRLDTSTFNILLNPLVRTGTQAQIQSHLAQMASHNCAPDVVTFTIILNGIIANKDSAFHAQPSNAQESVITSILKDMEDKGLQPNPQTYSTLLVGLLGNENAPETFTGTNTGNIPAARAILAYMQKRDLVPTPHHYTILISHYFTCIPPDLPAINSLWSSIRHSKQTRYLDTLFFNRMIERYADLDEIERALQFLRIVPQEGKSPGWSALHRVLAALERAGEWDLCRELISDVEDTKDGLLKHGQGYLQGKREFYQLVDDLRARGVTMGGEEQM